MFHKLHCGKMRVISYRVVFNYNSNVVGYKKFNGHRFDEFFVQLRVGKQTITVKNSRRLSPSSWRVVKFPHTFAGLLS